MARSIAARVVSSTVASLRESSTVLRGLEGQEWVEDSAEELADRMRSVVRHVLGRLTSTDPSLIADSLLNQLDGPTREVLRIAGQLRDGAPGLGADYGTANGAMDNLLVSAVALPEVSIRTPGTILERAAEEFAEQLETTITEFKQDVQGLREETSQTREQFLQNASQLETRSSEFTEQATQRISEAETASSSALDDIKQAAERILSEVSEASERLGREVTNIQQAFSDSQRDRETSFLQSQQQHDNYFHKSVDPQVEDIGDLTEQAHKMLQEVAGASTAEHYVTHRDRQNFTANVWRFVGVGGLVALVAAAVWIFWQTGPAEEDFDVAWLVARTGLLGAILLFATYALRQSGQHRRREEETSRVANELQLLWPFISRLPEADRQILMKEITPLYFRGGLPSQNSEASRGRIQTLVSRTRTALGNGPKTTND